MPVRSDGRGRVQQHPYDDSPTVQLEIISDRTVMQPAGNGRPRRRRKRGWLVLLAVVVLLGGIAGGGMYLYRTFVSAPDYAGPGSGDVVVQVENGDPISKIGAVL